MRSLAIVGLLGSFLLITGIQAQSLSEHAAAAAGATIGTAAGKPLSNAITKIFGTVDDDAKKAAATKVDTKAQPKTTAPASATAPAPALGIKPSDPPLASHSSSPSTGTRRHSTPAASSDNAPTTVQAAEVTVSLVPPAPTRKEPTAEELAAVKVGATASEVLAVLGPPESRVTIPDEGHMLEICQYWSNGKQLGTIRLDNGQVVTVESKSQN
ncbi:MAG TPA: hypothetical protein VGV35_11490 [Bryobacteraceae bacterium]|nr:hypothetical protein [Bryobacteraceae bacterium]